MNRKRTASGIAIQAQAAWRPGFISLVVTVLLALAPLSAAVSDADTDPQRTPSATKTQPQAAPGSAKYIVVLETKKGTERPDFEQAGATVDFESGNKIAIRIPPEAVEGLRRNPNVQYIQRVLPVDEAIAVHQRSGSGTGASAEASKNIDPDSSPANWTSGTYLYDGSGNIRAIGSQGASGSQIYKYDNLGRLERATFPTMGGPVTEEYEYDTFGNMTSRTGSAKSVGAIAVDPATNRLTGAHVAYDAAGNMTRNATHTYHFDPLNMMREITYAPAAQIYYIYTASDERIGTKDNAAARWRWTIRDLEGKVQREYESYGTYATQHLWLWTEDTVYRDGALLAAQREEAAGGRLHFHLDHLGTPRQITNANREQLSRNDYYPFGQEASPITQMAVRNYPHSDRQYTGHERDYHSGVYAENVDYLDYMHARYYNPNLGRFLSTDPGSDWDSSTPQSWNMYSYVRNNPVNAADPTGKYFESFIEVISIGIGVHSLVANVNSGQYLASAVDAGGILVDGVALAIPVVPGGAGAALKGLRATNKIDDAADVAKNSDRVGMDFTPAGKRQIDAANAQKYGGKNVCETCGTDVVPGKKHQAGVTPPKNERHRDHKEPKAKGGSGSPSNGQILCRNCNIRKSDKSPACVSGKVGCK